MRPAFTTQSEDTFEPSLPNVLYSKAVLVRGNLCFDIPIVISIAKMCGEAPSAGSLRWLTGIFPPTCVSKWPTGMATSIDSISRATLTSCRAGFNSSSETLTNVRHSLSNRLVNKAKVEPKTVQGVLPYRKIQTTLDLYTQEDRDETLAAQGEYLKALGVSSSKLQ